MKQTEYTARTRSSHSGFANATHRLQHQAKCRDYRMLTSADLLLRRGDPTVAYLIGTIRIIELETENKTLRCCTGHYGIHLMECGSAIHSDESRYSSDLHFRKLVPAVASSAEKLSVCLEIFNQMRSLFDLEKLRPNTNSSLADTYACDLCTSSAISNTVKTGIKSPESVVIVHNDFVRAHKGGQQTADLPMRQICVRNFPLRQEYLIGRTI